ncbi:MAG: cupin domain-containing protein [Candidatus Heimdallarchaeota archaeon]
MKKIKGKPWQPIEITKVNEAFVRLALLKGEYHWHKHTKEDEMFLVIQGEFIMHLRDEEDVLLKEGELITIPKGVEHKPNAKKEAYVLLFERQDIITKGD